MTSLCEVCELCVCVCALIHACACRGQRSKVLSTFLMQALSLNLELIILARLATQRDRDARVAPSFCVGAGI